MEPTAPLPMDRLNFGLSPAISTTKVVMMVAVAVEAMVEAVPVAEEVGVATLTIGVVSTTQALVSRRKAPMTCPSQPTPSSFSTSSSK